MRLILNYLMPFLARAVTDPVIKRIMHRYWIISRIMESGYYQWPLI